MMIYPVAVPSVALRARCKLCRTQRLLLRAVAVGRTVVRRSDAGAASELGNVIWLMLIRLAQVSVPSTPCEVAAHAGARSTA
jgi:hypothetical protein